MLDLKANYLASPDPTEWSAQTTSALLLEVAPTKVVMPREETMLWVPALGVFFEFLQSTDRWSAASMPAYGAQAFLREMEFGAIEAFDDPSRRSFSANIMRYAVDLGLDLSDPQMVERYMTWYNNLSHAERIEISDTGKLVSPSSPFDPTAPLPSDGNVIPGGFTRHGSEDEFWDEDDFTSLSDLELASAWPWFLGELPDPDEPILSWDPAQLPAEYEASDFVLIAHLLLTMIGDGRKLTATGALNRADTTEALNMLGIQATFRSMWDIPEIVGPWRALTDGDWVRIEGNRATPGPGLAPAVPPSVDPDGFANFAHLLLTRLLLSLTHADYSEGGFANTPDTLQALLVATRTEGLVLPGMDVLTGDDLPVQLIDQSTGDLDPVELSRLLDTHEDLELLTKYRVIWGEGDHYRAPMIVRVALGVVLATLYELDADDD